MSTAIVTTAAAVAVTAHGAAATIHPSPPLIGSPAAAATSAPSSGPYVVDLPGCTATAAVEASAPTSSVVAGEGAEQLQTVIWSAAGGPAGESYLYQAESRAPITGARLTTVDPKDGTGAYFWSTEDGHLRAALNGFRTDPARLEKVAAAVVAGTLPQGYVAETGPIDLGQVRDWQYSCDLHGERLAVRAVEGSPAARAAYLAGSRHSAVLQDTDSLTVLTFGVDVPVRKATAAEWADLLRQPFPEDRPA